jgi:hypothetical protein
MYDFVYLSVRRSVRDSRWSRDYRDGTGIRVFYENPGFYISCDVKVPTEILWLFCGDL